MQRNIIARGAEEGLWMIAQGLAARKLMAGLAAGFRDTKMGWACIAHHPAITPPHTSYMAPRQRRVGATKLPGAIIPQPAARAIK